MTQPRRRPKKGWTQKVIDKWSEWRNRDHTDNAYISRSDICTLLDEIKRLEAREPT